MEKFMQREHAKTYQRLIDRLNFAKLSATRRKIFIRRLAQIFPEIYELLAGIYGTRRDFFYHLEAVLQTAVDYTAARPDDLHALDAEREKDPLWFQSEKMLAAMLYVDLFAGNLQGVRGKIPYLKELGITYLHLMPLFRSPEENSDGGYAVSSFREVNPALGTIDELRALAQEFRLNGISLTLDFVFNHTSDEHDWALKALAGDEDFQDYYLIFPDRTLPDQYQPMLRDIFPDQAPGSFTYRPEIEKWVWTTFNTFQWDLNYRNPEVFNAMLGEMLFLANVGVEILRLDAVAFIWKEMGTVCENLPQAHQIIQAFNALVRLVAPAMALKSEAIVHPDEVEKYFGQGEKAGYECPISYNPTLMALLWETLATREVRLLHHSMQKRFAHPPNCAWVNYVRCHDDIGWSFADEDAREIHINGFNHRLFLNNFYTGQFPDSFARGLIFNYNPVTQDGRITGTCASLAGLEFALKSGEKHAIDLAIQRILLIHSIILSIGGIPLLYIGDEIATRNDYSYEQDTGKAADNRWVHRPKMDWERAENRHDPNTIEGRVYQNLLKLIHLRQHNPIFAGGETRIVETGNPHVFGYQRWREGQGFLALCNFSEREQTVDVAKYRVFGLKLHMREMATGEDVVLNGKYTLQPYQFLWLNC